MVKLIYCLHRLPNLSREEFQRYWREHHGPLVVSHKDDMKVQRYVQCHTIDDARMDEQRRASGRPEWFDGVAELWWKSIEDFAPAEPSAARQKSNFELDQDERKFIDLARSPVWLAEEFPFVQEIPEDEECAKPSLRIKLVYCLRRLPNLSLDDFQRYWRINHGPLVRIVATAIGTRRYVQSHTRYDETNEMMRAPMNRPIRYDGVAELWWDSMESRRPEIILPERMQANATLFEDEKKFIEHSQSPVFLTKEWVFVSR
jgi:hypothetical protein